MVKDINLIVGNNIRNFIAAKNKQHTWVIERTGMSKKTFYNLLDGKGNVTKHTEVIAKLFRKDPLYFYQNELELPSSTLEINEKYNFVNLAAASYHVDHDKVEFLETMKILDEFIEIVDVMKTVVEDKEIYLGKGEI